MGKTPQGGDKLNEHELYNHHDNSTTNFFLYIEVLCYHLRIRNSIIQAPVIISIYNSCIQNNKVQKKLNI